VVRSGRVREGLYGAVAAVGFGYNPLAENQPAPADVSRFGLGGPNRKESIVIVTVSARHMDVSPALKTYAEEKAGRLSKYYDRIQEIEVIFDAGKDRTTVEFIVNAEHKNMFLAHHNDGDAYAGVDACFDKLERQLSDHKKKVRNRKHNTEDKHTMK
jgi:putative sigma-54 modulation protein